MRSPRARFAGDETLGTGDAGEAGHAAHRAEQVHQCGEVVGPHVEHRTAARLVVERRVGVPALVAGAGHERHRVQRLADPAVVDQLAAGLVAAAEEGVGRAAEQHAGSLRAAHQVLALGARHRQRLLAPHVLAGIDRRPRYRVVCRRNGQVHHQVDRVVGNQLFRRERARDAELRRLRRRALANQVGARHHVQNGKLPAALEVGRADLAASDDADPQSLHQPSIRALLYRRLPAAGNPRSAWLGVLQGSLARWGVTGTSLLRREAPARGYGRRARSLRDRRTRRRLDPPRPVPGESRQPWDSGAR